MNNFFRPPVSQEDLRRQLASQRAGRQRHPPQHASPSEGPVAAAPNTAMVGGDSIDDIIRDNLQRRHSVSVDFGGDVRRDDADRGLSAMDIGAAGGHLQGFRFGDLAPSGDGALGAVFGGVGSTMGVQGHPAAYEQSGLMAMPDPTFADPSMESMNSDMMALSDLTMGSMQPGHHPPLDMYGPSGLADQLPGHSGGPVDPSFAMGMDVDGGSLAAVGVDSAGGLSLQGGGGGGAMAAEHAFSAASEPRSSLGQQTPSLPHSLGSFQPSLSPLSRGSQGAAGPQPTAAAAEPPPPPSSALTANRPAAPPGSKHKNFYSKSGFDMLRALWYVATRKNPEVQLGAVDMSCSFVVCDVTLPDCPIIYVSDNFQNLTGYSQHEIMGKNCRFLQSPDGLVEAGSKREFVENSAVLNLKRSVAEGREIQQGLINYRKGGTPFLNLVTMIPIPWDTDEIRYFIGFQIDLVECPDAISGQDAGGMMINYMHSDIGQYIWTPPLSSQWEPENGQTLAIDDVSTLLQQCNRRGASSDWHRQSWDKMLLENADDVVHVLSLKGLFLYLSPSCKRVLEYDSSDMVGTSLSSICHPSDIVPVTRELKDATSGNPVNIVFRIRRKQSGYTWFESRGSLFVEQGKGRKCIILVGRKRPVLALQRRDLEARGGIGDSEFWTKLSTSGIFLFVSSSVRSLLDLLPENLQGTTIQDLMRRDSRIEFGRAIEQARKGKIVSCKHEVQNKRGQVLQAHTTLYPGDAFERSSASFLLAQTRLLKASPRAVASAVLGNTRPAPPASSAQHDDHVLSSGPPRPSGGGSIPFDPLDAGAAVLPPADGMLSDGSYDAALASEENIFDELKTTRVTSWQYELRQMEKVNRLLAEELAQLLSSKKKRKRRKGSGNMVRDCANCHTRSTPEWRRGPSGNRDLCNSCGLRWAKQTGRISPRTNNSNSNSSSNNNNNNNYYYNSNYNNTGPNNSSPRGSADNGQSERCSSSVQSSPLALDGTADSDTSRSSTASATNRGGGGAGPGPGPGPGPGVAAAAAAAAAGHLFAPPQSQPLLSGGSGLGGGGMEMTAIREEQEGSS